MLNLGLRYPGRVITTDPAYPYGKARDRATPGDGTGTPWQEDLANDLHGALQAIVEEGGITISGTPEAVGASDVVDGIHAIITADTATLEGRVDTAESDITTLETGLSTLIGQLHAAQFTLTGAAPYGAALTVTTRTGYTSYTEPTPNEIQVPEDGLYEVTVTGGFQTDNTSDNATISLRLRKAGSGAGDGFGTRPGTSVGAAGLVAFTFLVTVDDPATDTISVAANSSSYTITSAGARLVIKRIGPVPS